MTIDQALEQVKARHLKQQEEKALEAQRKAEAAKAAAEARRKKKPKKMISKAKPREHLQLIKLPSLF